MTSLHQMSDLPELSLAWATLQRYASIRPIRNEADFERIHALANELSDEVGDDETHPLFSLFEIVMDLIERWEVDHVVVPASSPHEVLRHLLEENGLKQKDLLDIASPSLISDILSGRREISKKLAKALAARFHVGIDAFVQRAAGQQVRVKVLETDDRGRLKLSMKAAEGAEAPAAPAA